MKIPPKLKIGGHIYKVKKVKLTGLGEEMMAKLSRSTNEIIIDIAAPQSQIEENLIHEIMHGINGIIDHPLLESLAHQLYQVLKDNNLLR